MNRSLAIALLFALPASTFAAEWTLVNKIETEATFRDAARMPKGAVDSANLNRFGFYSDLVFDAKTGDWYALSDRGPGGGLIDYAMRVQRLRSFAVDFAR